MKAFTILLILIMGSTANASDNKLSCYTQDGTDDRGFDFHLQVEGEKLVGKLKKRRTLNGGFKDEVQLYVKHDSNASYAINNS